MSQSWNYRSVSETDRPESDQAANLLWVTTWSMTSSQAQLLGHSTEMSQSVILDNGKCRSSSATLIAWL
jgi:hypothetical protein